MKNYLKPFILLPASPGKCPECASEHDPDGPHNQQSLFYQYRFYGKHDRWPTWEDAMAHCPDFIKEIAKEVIRETEGKKK